MRLWTAGAFALFGLIGCADQVLTGEGTAAPPSIVIESPADGSLWFLDDLPILEARVADPNGEAEDVSVVWASSIDGPLQGARTNVSGAATLVLDVPPSAGPHRLVAFALDDEGGTARASIRVDLIDADRDRDGHRAIAHGGDDCADDNPEIHPGAEDVCDGIDQDCDLEIDEDGTWQTWFLDADADGFGHRGDEVFACGAPDGRVLNDEDCHDDQPERRHCVSCWDLLNTPWDQGDGDYTIDPVGGAPFVAACDMTFLDGGWTLIGTQEWDQAEPDVVAWNPINTVNDEPFGPEVSRLLSFKSPAFSSVAFDELRFENGDQHAYYRPGLGATLPSYYAWQATIPLNNCGDALGVDRFPMLPGSTLTDENGRPLCDTDLYVHVNDHDGSGCNRFSSISEVGYGPTWSTSNNNGCPLDDVYGSGFRSGQVGPWPLDVPLRMWVRARQ